MTFRGHLLSFEYDCCLTDGFACAAEEKHEIRVFSSLPHLLV